MKLIDLNKKLQALEDELSRTNNGSKRHDGIETNSLQSNIDIMNIWISALKAMVEETKTILGGLVNYEMKNASVVLGTLVTCSKGEGTKNS